MNFITPEQVAEMFKVSSDTVLQWLKNKKLPGIKIGNVWRIEESRLNDFLISELDSPKCDVLDYELLEEEFNVMGQSAKGRKRGRKPSGKYDGLKKYLGQVKGDQVKLSFSEIESHMNEKLPHSAYKLRPWWGNDFSHSQARAWIHAGWETNGVDLTKREITFVRRT